MRSQIFLENYVTSEGAISHNVLYYQQLAITRNQVRFLHYQQLSITHNQIRFYANNYFE